MLGLILLLTLEACQPKDHASTEEETPSGPVLFSSLPASETGLEFVNDLEEDVMGEYNVLSYEYYFNGGGVGIGDFNNDGLPDLVLTANTSENKLFLNKGNMKFEDVTAAAGINQGKQWSTGVAVVDINGDGWQDIYICQGGPEVNPNLRRNLLFINNGMEAGATAPSFTEKAAEYGLGDSNRSNQAAFFDYDKDGDLDCFVINNAKILPGGFSVHF
ncbi:MAG: VCBS repeat-containing protein [Saprospirales bacterium]|nr:VCBS repeat-containing protein [Saprospirales bacterium]